MTVLKSVKKAATKLAIQTIGIGAVIDSQQKNIKHSTEQKEQIDKMKNDAQKFQSHLSEVTKGKWTDAAKTCISETIETLS